MALEIIFANHQDEVSIPVSWIVSLEAVGQQAADLALKQAVMEDSPLAHLAVLEVTLVDNETSSRVHRDFMGIEGETDVITFHHGEIVIGAEVAAEQAADFREPLGRELLRYFIHGLLHLAGHEDENPEDRARMEKAQEEIVAELWATNLSEKLV